MHFRKMILTNESIWMCVGELELIVIFSFLRFSKRNIRVFH